MPVKGAPGPFGCHCDPSVEDWVSAQHAHGRILARICWRCRGWGPFESLAGIVREIVRFLKELEDRIVAALNQKDESDTEDDTGEKNQKIRRKMNSPAQRCATEYRRLMKSGEQPTMKQVVADYVEENCGSEDGIMRILNDNPDQWKDNTKTT